MNKSLAYLCGALVAWWGATAQAIEVQEIRTPSGITAWLVEDHSLPLLSVKIAFRDAGAASDPEPLYGRAYLTGELLMEGAGVRDSLAFHQELDARAIRLSTSVDEDLIMVGMETLSDEIPAAFSLLGDMLVRPRFDETAVRRLRDQTLARLRLMEATPDYALQRAWEKAAYGTHPYASPTFGTPQTLAKIDRTAIAGFARDHLTRGNIVVAVTGDISASQLQTELEKNLAALPAAFKAAVRVSDTTLASPGQVIRVEKDVPQTVAAFGIDAVKRTDPNYFSAFVMNQILGGGGSLNSRLGDEIREKRGLTYSIDSQLDTKLRSGVLSGGFATRNEKVAEALELLKNTVATMHKDGAQPNEIEDAKEYLTGSFPLNIDTNSDVASYLISMQLYNLGENYLDERNNLIRAVTREQVNAMASQLLDPGKLLIVLVGKTQGAK